MNKTVRALLLNLKAKLGAGDASRELRWMQETLQAEPSRGLEQRDLEGMLRRRLTGEPLQYILGIHPFGSNLELKIQPETEDWAIRLANHLKPGSEGPLSVLDLCTGSGCIPLLLCAENAKAIVHALGVDVSDHAVQLAQENSRMYGFDGGIRSIVDQPKQPASTSQCSTFEVLRTDIFAPAFAHILSTHPLRPFNVLTSNPPYILRTSYDALPASVREWEDSIALVGEAPPLNLPGAATPDDSDGLAPGLIVPDGWLALEVGGGDQADAVEQILQEHRVVRSTTVWKDPWGIKRTVVGRV
ncbi:hypothetical protein BS47DRAFT_1335876 [Hydnum rufescens UP504]|uniref:Release factor glutamine methyltransferase N-terminal domain-containing protein n=1 Tax=Hydnum rufescens UP504 TaxID=1448309 RepID=A0A9P6E2H4_9AGAM|nr:hypothetical protein BS47DRAFT_1335876 [Hydnum rufescens UP504]